MASQAEAAAARVAALLAAVTGISGVYRDRQDAFSREEGSCILVEIVADDAQPFAGARSTDQADFRFAVVYLTRSNGWQTVVDGLREQGHALLLGDATLTSLISGLRRDSARWQAASTDLPFGHCVQQYAGKYLSPTTHLRRHP